VANVVNRFGRFNVYSAMDEKIRKRKSVGFPAFSCNGFGGRRRVARTTFWQLPGRGTTRIVSALKCGELSVGVGINEAARGRHSYFSGKFIRLPLEKIYPLAWYRSLRRAHPQLATAHYTNRARNPVPHDVQQKTRNIEEIW
jgi:hypothetical protein